MDDYIRAKARLIYNFRTFPVLAIEPDEPGLREIVALERQHYMGLSGWLEFYLLGRAELYQQLFFTPLVGLKPFADKCLALFAFCQQVWSRSEWAQTVVASPEMLWATIEYSNSQARLRKAWLTDSPYMNSQNKIMSRAELRQFSNASLAIFKKALRCGLTVPEVINSMVQEVVTAEITPEPTKELNRLGRQLNALTTYGSDPDPLLYLHTWLIGEGVRLAAAGDAGMEHDCQQYFKALEQFNRIIGSSGNPYQMVYLPSPIGDIKQAGKSRKMVQPQGFEKRGRGRPPKGQERQKM